MYDVIMILDKKHKCLGSRKVCGVYKITNIKNNKIYIGSSNNIHQRWKNHIRELETNKHSNIYLQNDWDMYEKDNFKFEVIEECAEDVRYSVEQKYLNELMPFYRTGNGYNICEKSTERNNSSLRLFQSKEECSDYYVVKVKGCKPYIMDGEHCRNTLREDLEEECYSLTAYDELKKYILEINGYDDDWC